jgi:hypothetical protein
MLPVHQNVAAAYPISGSFARVQAGPVDPVKNISAEERSARRSRAGTSSSRQMSSL